MPKTSTAAVAAALAALILSACGGSTKTSHPSSPSAPTTSTPAPTASSPSSSTATAGALSVAADPSGQLKFTKSSLTAKAGKVTIKFTNDTPVAHNLTIQQGTGGPVIGATPTFMGGSKTLTVTLKSGTYTYYCSVPGHRDAGMHGTLTVR